MFFLKSEAPPSSPSSLICPGCTLRRRRAGDGGGLSFSASSFPSPTPPPPPPSPPPTCPLAAATPHRSDSRSRRDRRGEIIGGHVEGSGLPEGPSRIFLLHCRRRLARSHRPRGKSSHPGRASQCRSWPGTRAAPRGGAANRLSVVSACSWPRTGSAARSRSSAGRAPSAPAAGRGTRAAPRGGAGFQVEPRQRLQLAEGLGQRHGFAVAQVELRQRLQLADSGSAVMRSSRPGRASSAPAVGRGIRSAARICSRPGRASSAPAVGRDRAAPRGKSSSTG